MCQRVEHGALNHNSFKWRQQRSWPERADTIILPPHFPSVHRKMQERSTRSDRSFPRFIRWSIYLLILRRRTVISAPSSFPTSTGCIGRIIADVCFPKRRAWRGRKRSRRTAWNNMGFRNMVKFIGKESLQLKKSVIN